MAPQTRRKDKGPSYQLLPESEHRGQEDENDQSDRDDDDSDANLEIQDHPAPAPSAMRIRHWKNLTRNWKGVTIIALLTTILLVLLSIGNDGEEPSDDGLALSEHSAHIADDARLEKYQSPSDASCTSWPASSDGDGKTSQVSFELNADSSLTFFVARGAPTDGHLIIFSGQTQNLEQILVNVTAEYHNRADLEKTKACVADTSDEESGILIWADEGTSQAITFNITVEVPPHFMRDFSTDFSSGSYSQQLIKDYLVFDVLRLKTANGPVKIDTLVTNSTFIRTTNAPVDVVIMSRDQAHIRTTKAPIDAMVLGMGGKHRDINTDVSMITSDAWILAALGMASDRTATLNASIHTTNGEFNITTPRVITEKPILYLNASTSNADAHVHLFPAFEGSFDVSTSRRGTARLYWDPNAYDPSKAKGGRKRVLALEKGNGDGRRAGNIYWGEEVPRPERMGEVKVKTTRRNVWLYST